MCFYQYHVFKNIHNIVQLVESNLHVSSCHVVDICFLPCSPSGTSLENVRAQVVRFMDFSQFGFVFSCLLIFWSFLCCFLFLVALCSTFLVDILFELTSYCFRTLFWSLLLVILSSLVLVLSSTAHLSPLNQPQLQSLPRLFSSVYIPLGQSQSLSDPCLYNLEFS